MIENVEQVYSNACQGIFLNAVDEQIKFDQFPENGNGKLQGFRVALKYLRPDLTSDEIYDEIVRVAAAQAMRDAAQVS